MKKLLSLCLGAALLCSSAAASNPEITEAEPGTRVYCGDPAALVEDTDGDGEGDIVYLYVGHDTGDGGYYSMPDYLCYSSADMMNWKYEGVPLRAADFSWGSPNDAWASQVIKHGDKYYFYNSKNSSGMSVAVSASPTGPFTDAKKGERLVEPGFTNGKVGWDDIDPTVWVENDENGVEHRYLMWGNSNLYLAELNEDMISLANGRAGIKEIEINGIPENSQYTEAPWIYRRPGDNRYYVFFASNWHEELSYAVSDNIWGPYEYSGLVMGVGASSNTNHPAIIDFKGQTYIIYHTGAQPNGGGYLRNVCVDRLYFDENGGVAQLEESSVGLDGRAVSLSLGGEKLSQLHFDNSFLPSAYPAGTTLELGENSLYPNDSLWEVTEGDGGVFIQAVNKMGYYITEYRGMAKLLHDNDDNSASLGARTFIPHESGGLTAFESKSLPGKYLAADEFGNVIFSDQPAYFEIAALAEQSLEVRLENGKIVINGTAEPGAELVIVISAPNGTHIAYSKANGDGAFACGFAPETAGTYRITASGRVAELTVGGDAE